MTAKLIQFVGKLIFVSIRQTREVNNGKIQWRKKMRILKLRSDRKGRKTLLRMFCKIFV